MPRKSNSFCSICNKAFYKRPSEAAKSLSGLIFCSRVCVTIHQTRQQSCPVCDTKFRSGLRKKYCSRACANTARKGISYFTGQRKNKHTTAVGYRSALVRLKGEKCEDCGYDEVPGIICVHHIIERKDGGTNDLSNLKLLCPNCHAIVHYGRADIGASNALEKRGTLTGDAVSNTVSSAIY